MGFKDMTLQQRTSAYGRALVVTVNSLDLPNGKYIKVALCQRESLVLCPGQPESKCQNGQGEREETGNDKKKCPQSETVKEREFI